MNNSKKEINDLKKYKAENEQLKKEINKLKEENNRLNTELFKSKKIIANFNNVKQNNQNDNNMINNLNELIKVKDNLINDLKKQIQNNSSNVSNKSVNYDDIIFVHFISPDQNINCPIKCLKTETFAEVEEKLYKKYEEYRETNNDFIAKGKLVLRFKKICENGIKDGDKVQLFKPQ